MSFPYIVVYCEDPAGIQFKASYQYRPQAQGRVYRAVRKIIFNQPLYKMMYHNKNVKWRVLIISSHSLSYFMTKQILEPYLLRYTDS